MQQSAEIVLNTPVVLIVFNRPEPTERVFAAIAKAQPSQLLVIADGPRFDRPGESALCSEVRRIVSNVDWPCKVDTNFAAENMGCRRRVISGLDWAFSLVDEAVILEDDCLPDQSFFPFCSELLERYRDNHRIGIIAGFNLEGSFQHKSSYYFSPLVPIWGWATWRRSWQKYDEHMRNWPTAKQSGILRRMFPNNRVATYWENMFDRMVAGTGPNTWDYQLVFTSWAQNWLNVIPTTNLIENIGFGHDATHTTKSDPLASIESHSMPFPLRHPSTIASWQSRTMKLQKKVYAPSFFNRVGRKISKSLKIRSASR